jgi:hypothetical protein
MNTAPCIRYRLELQSPLVFPLALVPGWLPDRILTLAKGAPKPSSGIGKQFD